jgi:hypothetical protein
MTIFAQSLYEQCLKKKGKHWYGFWMFLMLPVERLASSGSFFFCR